MKIWASDHKFRYPQPLFGPQIGRQELTEGVLWPYPPEWVVRFWPDESPYLVDIELGSDDEGNHYVSGISVRSGAPTSGDGTSADPWLEGGDWEPVTPRDVKRMALSRYARAAKVLADDLFTQPGLQAVRRILLPKGRPERGRGTGFYLEMLAMARSLEAQGIPAVAEIARRKKVDRNLVHQWLYRARKLEATARQKGSGARPRKRRKT